MIRYGVLDFGLHAVRRLTPGFALATNSRLTALSRRDIKQAEASAAEYKIPYAFDSAAALCRSPEVDAVFVATPNCSHLKDVLLAIESGKLVLCEKPMGMTADSAPTRQSYEVFDMLSKAVDEQLAKWKAIVSTDVAAYNNLVKQQVVPAIMLTQREAGK